MPLEPSEDARLVAKCLEGDPRAWEAIVRRHERLVYAVGRSYRLSDEDMGDVFQEVFAALVRGLPRLKDPRTLVRWLASTSQRIARATALRRRREAARTVEIDPPGAPLLAADAPGVGQPLEQLEEQALVRLAMGSLSERCQTLLAALYFEDPTPSYGTISRRMGLPVGSLGPTRARCFERLREAYERLLTPPAGITDAPMVTFDEEEPGPDRARSGPAAAWLPPEPAAMEDHP